MSVAAHATGGGGLPSSSAATLLVLLAITIGVLVATIRDAADLRMLLTLLGLGQLLGHALLSAAGHSHGSAVTVPWSVMLAAHVAALTVGAVLIAAGGYLCAAISRVVRAITPPAPRPVTVVPAFFGGGADQPLRSALELAASVSHRGPPVSFPN